jgi:membrane protein YdbS with pleckstrin-like domain
MAYIDNMLASGEQPIKREHQHWFALIADARYGIALIIAATALFFLSANLSGVLRNAMSVIVPVLLIVGLLIVAWQLLRWRNEEYVVTTRRVLQLEGVVNKRALDSSLEKINDAVLSQSIFGRLFGFGDLDILTAAETGISRLRMLRQADDFKRAMLEAKHELELELSGAKPLPSPPLRAPAPPVAATAQPAASPGPAPRAEMTPDELTRTLASLADLRDRGAISAEEYEAKKADLLGRL